jgi:hypothetical protein
MYKEAQETTIKEEKEKKTSIEEYRKRRGGRDES